MFKKELADVLKQSILFLAFLAAVPAAILALRIVPKQPYQALFTPTVQAGLLFWSFFLGASILGRERRQRAVEYMSSLPYSRLGLLARLAAPRLLVMMTVWALTLFLPTAWIQSYGFLPPQLLGPAAFLIFTVALSLAPLFENFLVLAFTTLLAFFVVVLIPFAAVALAYGDRGLPLDPSYLFTWREIVRMGSGAFPIGVLPFLPLLAFPFIAALLVAFPKFDIRPSPAFRRRFFLTWTPALLLTVLFSFAAIGHSIPGNDQREYYLTRDLRLVDFGFLSNRISIHDGKEVRQVKLLAAAGGGPWDVHEGDGALYFLDYRGAFNRLEIASGEAKTLYIPERSEGMWGGFWIFDSTYVFFEDGARPGEVRLVRFDLRTKGVARSTFFHETFRKGDKRLIGTGVLGERRFWICRTWLRYRNILLRLWDDGRVEKIDLPGKAEPGRLTYNDGLLFDSDKEGLTVFKDTGSSLEILKKYPPGETFLAFDFFRGRRLDRPNNGYLVGKRGTRIAKLDLTTLEIEDFGAWTGGKEGRWGSIDRLDDGRIFLLTGSRQPFTAEIYDLNGDRMRLIWSSPPSASKMPATGVWVFGSGILVTSANEIRAYAFPDMREIRFK